MKGATPSHLPTGKQHWCPDCDEIGVRPPAVYGCLGVRSSGLHAWAGYAWYCGDHYRQRFDAGVAGIKTKPRPATPSAPPSRQGSLL